MDSVYKKRAPVFFLLFSLIPSAYPSSMRIRPSDDDSVLFEAVEFTSKKDGEQYYKFIVTEDGEIEDTIGKVKISDLKRVKDHLKFSQKEIRKIVKKSAKKSQYVSWGGLISLFVLIRFVGEKVQEISTTLFNFVSGVANTADGEERKMLMFNMKFAGIMEALLTPEIEQTVLEYHHIEDLIELGIERTKALAKLNLAENVGAVDSEASLQRFWANIEEYEFK